MKDTNRYQFMAIFLVFFITACGSGGDSNKTPAGQSPTIYVGDVGVTNTSGQVEKVSYLVEKDLGLYIGYQKVSLVTPDGRLHDPAYNLVTSQIAQGVYLTSQPDAKYDYRYHVRLKRYYFDGVPQPEGSTVEIGLSFDPEAYETYYARIPGNLYY